MNILSTLKVVIVTNREDLVNFCRGVLNYKASVTVENNPSVKVFGQKSYYVIEAEMLHNANAEFLEKLKICSNKILFILPSDGSVQSLDYFDSICKYSVSFPLEENHFMISFNKMIKDNSLEVGANSGLLDSSVSDTIMGFFGGTSRGICEVRRRIEKAASVKTPVLLLGETGTGKSTAAKLIHDLSDRRKNAFKDKNVSTISDTLACSTLFGTESGAFTDAVKNEGLFRIANGGTLFLDEIGMASLSLQAMLLTVIETGMIQKVGSEKSEKVDVRLIFATNAPILEMMKEGVFRSDLYFRISDIIIQIPPLRDRKEDILILAEEYVTKRNKKLSEEAVKKLEVYDWPGNIREFLKCLENACDNSADSVIQPVHIDFGIFE